MYFALPLPGGRDEDTTEFLRVYFWDASAAVTHRTGQNLFFDDFRQRIFVISNEASMALSDKEEERPYVLNRVLPKVLIGGFTTVTIGFVVLAGYLAKINIASRN